MGLSRRKALQAADLVGRTSLQASYTLWLARNQEKFSRWTLVEKPHLTDRAPAVDQTAHTATKKTLRKQRNARCPSARPGADHVPSPAKQVTSSASDDGGDCETGDRPRGMTNLGNRYMFPQCHLPMPPSHRESHLTCPATNSERFDQAQIH